MAHPFSHEDLAKLKNFIDFVMVNPTILNFPQLDFVKAFIEKFGGTVPPGEFKMPAGGKCPFGGDGSGGVKAEPKPAEAEVDSSPEEVEMDESDAESEVELDMDGVIEPDAEADQPMGDSSKTPTEEEIDQASELRSQAAAAYGEQKYEEAIALYTQAIELNPGNALFHAKRGQAFLKLQKPNACIRDCDEALKINCDSAAAYKFRGRAHRLLGNWEAAAKDLRQACKLDFDEEADEWLREVTPNAKKIEQHAIKQERKRQERALRAAEAARRAREREAKKREQRPGAGPAGAGGFPDFSGLFGGAGGGGGAGGMNLGDLLSGVQDPDVAAALEDIAKNPANIDKYKSNPKIAKLIEVVKGMAGKQGGGGFPGFMPGFPGAGADMGGGPAGSTPPPETEQPQANEPPKTQPKKPDFVDDGLD